MVQTRKSIGMLLVVSCCVGAGCAKKRGGAGELNDEQKQQLRELIQSTGTGASVVMNSNGNLQRRTQLLSTMAQQDTNYHSMESAMEACQIESSWGLNYPLALRMQNLSINTQSRALGTDGQPEIGKKQEDYFRVSGEDCPIYFELKTASVLTSMTAGQFELSVNYKVLAESYRELNDVDAFDLKAFGNAQWNEKTIEVNARWNGGVHSQKVGQVGLPGSFMGSGEIEGEHGQFSLRQIFDFPKFSAVLDLKSKDGSEEYYLNGKRMSEEEVAAFFKNAFQSEETHEPTPVEQNPESPTR